MDNLKILITAASSALAYKLEKELPFTDSVIFADSFDLPEIMIKKRKFIKIPGESSESFSHQLLSICLDMEIQAVFPLRKFELIALAEARQLFQEYGIKVMVPQKDILNNLFGTHKTGSIQIIGLKGDDGSIGQPDRGVFLFNAGAQPEIQILTVD